MQLNIVEVSAKALLGLKALIKAKTWQAVHFNICLAAEIPQQRLHTTAVARTQRGGDDWHMVV